MDQIYISFLPDSNNVLSILNGFYYNDETPPEGSIQITENQFNQCMDILNVQQKLLWLDADDEIQSRDKLSNWDAEAQTFVPDQAAIDAQNKAALISDATILFKGDVIYSIPYSSGKFNNDEQTQITTYLDSLYDIVFNPDTQQTTLPVRPTFLA